MLSNQRLVGRHNMFALLDRALYQIVSRTGASNQLYQYIDFRIFSQCHHITADAGVTVVMVGVLPARTNVHQFHRLARSEPLATQLAHQDVHRGKADGAYTAHSEYSGYPNSSRQLLCCNRRPLADFLDAADRLTGAVLVLNQTKAHESLAIFAEAHTG